MLAAVSGGDDAGVMDFNAFNSGIGFVPFRDAGFDAAQRAWFGLMGAVGYFGTGPIELDRWYQFTCAASADASTVTATLVDLSDGSTFGTLTLDTSSDDVITSVTFRTEASNATGSVIWDDLVVMKAVPGNFAMNPAHILYDSITLRPELGGQGEPVGLINDASFRAAAGKLYAEGFGLCTTWEGDETAEAFQDRILDIIGGAISQSRVDGQYYLDLIRPDYDFDSLPILTETDVIEFSEQPTNINEAVNRVIVEWFDPEAKEKRATTPVVSLGAIQSAGGVISSTVTHREIPVETLALRVAARELGASATPLSRFDLTTNRRLYALRKGQFFRLQMPSEGIADMVCLAGEIDYGDLTTGRMKITAVQDVFGMPDTVYVDPAPGVDPGNDPAPHASTHQLVFEAPYTELAALLPSAELAGLATESGYLATVATRPAGTGLNYTIYSAADGEAYADRGTGDWCPSALILEAAAKGDTTFTITGGSDLDQVEVGTAALWGDEICRVDAINATAGTLTLGRGCADTVPATHAEGDRIYFYGDAVGTDTREYVDGETVHAKLLTRTSSGELDPGSAFDNAVVMDSRAARPYPPGLFQIDGADYPAANAGGSSMSVTWAHRDRQAQADTLQDTTAGNVGPEATVRCALRFLRADTSALLVEKLDLAGTAATAVLAYTGDVVIQLYSISDRGESWQRHQHTLAYTPPAGTTVSVISGPTYDPSSGGVIIDGGEVVLPPVDPPPPPPEGGGGTPSGDPLLTRTRGTTVLDVTDYGALGNGAHDDTAAIQACIDDLPGDGGTVTVPPGTYMVDSVRSVNLRSFMYFEIQPGAAVKAKPNTATHDYILQSLNQQHVEIGGGGEVIGDRDTFVDAPGTTSEWGHGIALWGTSHVTVRDLTISKCVGDGISFAQKKGPQSRPTFRIDNVRSTNNRRQGISVGVCTDFYITNCELDGINGTSPQAGIDVEPDYPDTKTARYGLIKGNLIRNNKGPGIQCWASSRDIDIEDNVIEYNNQGILLHNSYGGNITGNIVRHNRSKAISVAAGSTDYNTHSNTFFNNWTSAKGVILTGSTTPITGLSSATAAHIGTSTWSGPPLAMTFGTNEYGP
jgi:parallel beta-helix repeat protein